MTPQERIAQLKKIINTDVFVAAEDEPIADRQGGLRESGWLFDFRRVFMKPDTLALIGDIFWDRHKERYPVQVGGLEVAGVPLVTGIGQRMHIHGASDASTFFIRKSRKKDGLMRMIEGTVVKDRPIVLVDDIIYSGKSFIRQVEVLESLGYTVDTIWTILRVHDHSFYTYFHDKGITVETLFELQDFDAHAEPVHQPAMPFTIQWKFSAPNPNYFYVVPKSDPIIDAENVYIGSDSGVFWALKQHDGSTAWSRKVGFHPHGKGIFSSPALHENTVFFGAYDGNVYALDTETGKKRWVFFEADWVGSSPAVAPKLGLVFIGLEFGLFKKRGALVALDIHTGKKVWQHDMPAYTHSSPLYISEKKQVIVGSNDGVAYLFNAKNGNLVWSFETGHVTKEELQQGFSAHDIKESFAYDRERDYIVFGNIDGTLFVLNRKTGEEVFHVKADFGFYSTPLIYNNCAYASSVDKHLYCIDLNTHELKWKWYTGARIFASPIAVNGRIYIGANTGRFTELDPNTGDELGFITVPERITNKAAYNPVTKRFFVPTFANELYCLERDDTSNEPLPGNRLM